MRITLHSTLEIGIEDFVLLLHLQWDWDMLLAELGYHSFAFLSQFLTLYVK